MKHSYYNVLTGLDDGTYLLYNTYWESLAVLSEEEREAYLAAESASEQELEDPFHQALIDQHFIVDNPEDEADWIQYEYEKYKFNNRVFELVITPTIACNFCCAYCYERKRPGMMTEETQDAVFNFVQESYDELPFLEMRVTWYGGEPMLGANVIERLGHKFVDFCEEHGVRYHSGIMTNGSLCDECTMQRMYDAGVKSMMVTFGGKGEMHDKQRPANNGKSSYQTVYDNTVRMINEGTPVNVTYVYDTENLESCIEQASDFAAMENGNNVYTYYPYPLTDYNGDLAEGGEVEFDPDKVLKWRAESYRDLLMATKPDAEHWHQIIRPLHHHCGVHTERNYVIDELGRAYKCLCDMDKPESHALFNVSDAPEKRALNRRMLMYFMTYNVAKYEPCRSCPVMPICKGSCFIDHDPERWWVPTSCHPISIVIEDYLRAYYAALVEEGRV